MTTRIVLHILVNKIMCTIKWFVMYLITFKQQVKNLKSTEQNYICNFKCMIEQCMGQYLNIIKFKTYIRKVFLKLIFILIEFFKI